MTSKQQRRRTVLGQVLGVAFKVAEENERMRRALEYYAYPGNWRVDAEGAHTFIEPAAGKPTEVARKALAFRATYVTRPLWRRRRFWRAVCRFFDAAWRRVCDRSPAHH